jgi:lysozyme family protein
MAKFQPAYTAVMGAEGGYSNRAADRGGETYKGISRKYHPHWPGWAILDQYPLPDKKGADGNTTLQSMVRDFYKVEYWDKFQGDKFRSQTVAEEILDTAVNMGIGSAMKFLQRGLNVLNRRGKLYSDLEIDGGMGPATLSAVNTLTEDTLLFKVLNVLQGEHYVEIMLNDETQEDNARGWFSRVHIEKKV